eukprot:scaffold111430_cov21-Tisochrysis_lutea.AAC.2
MRVLLSCGAPHRNRGSGCDAVHPHNIRGCGCKVVRFIENEGVAMMWYTLKGNEGVAMTWYTPKENEGVAVSAASDAIATGGLQGQGNYSCCTLLHAKGLQGRGGSGGSAVYVIGPAH